MANASGFAAFIERIRAGDEQAARDLVRHYEAAIRLEVRLRLRDSRLRRLFDSMDICQSVLASFFGRVTEGQYDLADPAQLLKLLVVIARNKVACQARQQRCQRRDVRRVGHLDPAYQEAIVPGPSPSEFVARQELLRVVRQRLTDEERQLADARAQGRDWAEIAAEHGGTPKGRRMQLSRAYQRITQQMGLDRRSL